MTSRAAVLAKKCLSGFELSPTLPSAVLHLAATKPSGHAPLASPEHTCLPRRKPTLESPHEALQAPMEVEDAQFELSHCARYYDPAAFSQEARELWVRDWQRVTARGVHPLAVASKA